ncbi:MAG: TnpV protein [Eubacterium sp.]|nr:TnpV protein [Eubacterium sp.]
MKGRNLIMNLNFFGQKRLDYLKEHRPIQYNEMATQGTLQEHIMSIQEEAEQKWQLLMEQNQKEWKLTEQLKTENPEEWIGLMTNLKEEMRVQVLQELIYN